METAYVARIRIYPIKSLDPVEVEEAEIGIHSLRGDRAFAIVGADGRFVNGKRTGLVNQLQAVYDLAGGLVTLVPRAGGVARTFELREGNPELVAYLEAFFGMKVFFLQRSGGELMDIPVQSSVTVISTGSLESLGRDLAGHSLDDLRLRFRANIELGGVEAFWEDRLFHAPGVGVRFTVGDVEMVGMSPRARCNVPPRDPFTGETDKGFVKMVMASRGGSLPQGSGLLQFGGTYQVAVDCFLGEEEVGKVLRVGDEVRVGGVVDLGQEMQL
jgi:uncharacterized protein